MRGNDLRLVADAERIERIGGVLHGGPIGLAAHDDRNRLPRHRSLETPEKEAGDYRDGRRGGKAAAQPCGNRAAPPISAAKISQLGCMAPVRERGGISLSFANDVSEGWLDLLRCNTGSGDFLSCAGPTPSLGPFVAPRLWWRNGAACAHARPKSTHPWSF